MRNFVGRAMLWLAMLAMCAAGAMAEGGSMFDFNTARGGRRTDRLVYRKRDLLPRVSGEGGAADTGELLLLNVPEEGDYILRLYRMENGNYFLHTMFFYNGVNQIYRVLAFENGAWQQIRKIEDPGYTGRAWACGIRIPTKTPSTPRTCRRTLIYRSTIY